MDALRTDVCAICGAERSLTDAWFLIVEHRWEDKLKILQWDDRLASQPGVEHACSAKHVAELVIHWMTTGSLGYPFARIPLGGGGSRRMLRLDSPIETLGARQIGELAVHRESMERVLTENPHALKPILDALLDALQRETSRAVSEVTAGTDEAVGAISQAV